MKKWFKRSWVTYITEAAMVAFGVLLALLLTEWNDQRKTNANTEQTLQYLLAEMESNAHKFALAATYHKHLQEVSDTILTDFAQEELDAVYYTNTRFKHFNLPGWKGIGAVEPETIVFESAKMSGVFQEINVGTIQLISGTYKKLEAYDYLSEKVLQGFIDIDSHTKTVDVIRIIELMKFDLLNFEEHLEKELAASGKQLDSILKHKRYRK